VCGKPIYVAPEVLKESKYTKKVDIWSLGCLLFAMLSGIPPSVQITQKRYLEGKLKTV
jgi:serine/threonine protein kinase